MYEQLTEYLGDNASPEQAALVIDVCQMLVECGVREHMEMIDIEMRQVDMEGNAVFRIIENVLTPCVTHAASEFGVKFSEDATLGMMARVLRALHAIPNYDDLRRISDICYSDYEPEEIFSMVFSEVTGLDESLFDDTLASVDIDLLKKLRKLTYDYSGIEENAPSDPERNAVAVARCRYYLDIFEKQPNTVVTLLNQSFRPGSPIDHLRTGLNDLRGETPQVTAKNILGLLLMSSIDQNDILAAAGREIDAVYDNAIDITACYAELKRHFQKTRENE